MDFCTNALQWGHNGGYGLPNHQPHDCLLNTLRPRQHDRHFADDYFKRIFLNENIGMSIKISLEFVHKGPINNNPALVQIMAWSRSGDKPLSEPVMVCLRTHICVTRPNELTVYPGTDQRNLQSSASLALCPGNSPVTGEFHAQMTSNAENVSILWRHHVL